MAGNIQVVGLHSMRARRYGPQEQGYGGSAKEDGGAVCRGAHKCFPPETPHLPLYLTVIWSYSLVDWLKRKPA